MSFFDWHNREVPLNGRCFSWKDIDKIKASGRHFIVDNIVNLNEDDVRRDSDQSIASSAGGQNRRGSGKSGNSGNGRTKSGRNNNKKRLKIKNYTVRVVSKMYCEEMLDECAGYHAIWMYCREEETAQLKQLREQARNLQVGFEFQNNQFTVILGQLKSFLGHEGT